MVSNDQMTRLDSPLAGSMLVFKLIQACLIQPDLERLLVFCVLPLAAESGHLVLLLSPWPFGSLSGGIEILFERQRLV